MRHELLASARRISCDLKASENDCDAALANNARLVASLLDARRASGVPARIGRTAVGRAVEAMNHTVKARELLLDAHEELAQLNVRELAAGDLSECPDDWKAAGTLTIVGSETRAA